MKILVDWDNVVCLSSVTIPTLWNYLHPTKQVKVLKAEEVKWDFSNVLEGTDISLKDLLSAFDYKYFYNHAVYVDGAIETINELSKEHEITIVSKHMDSRKELTTKYINYLLPNVQIHFVDRFEDKKNINADIIIDDKEECLGGVQTLSILFGNYEYNQDYKGLRCNNWSTIKRYFDCVNKSLTNN